MSIFKLLVLVSLSFYKVYAQKGLPTFFSDSLDGHVKQEMLLIGTFHFNNPGADVAKTKSFDVLSESAQAELEYFSKKIQAYNPSKIFVEWPFDEQNELDSLYNLYKKGDYFKDHELSDFYRKNEIFQFAFRIAKLNDFAKVYGIDYDKTDFPYQKVMNDLKMNNQYALMEEIKGILSTLATRFDNMIASGASLQELIFDLNTPEIRYLSNNFHNNLLPLAGSTEDFNGAFLTSEWYKRNIHMWSLIQKISDSSDEKIVVLVGSGHAAMFEMFIRENKKWKTKRLNEVLHERY